MAREYWLLNPPTKRRRKVRRKRSRRNPALALYGNPRKKGRTMAPRKKTTRRRVYHKRRKTHARSNPPVRRKRRHVAIKRRRRFHRNPGGAGTKLFGGLSIPPVKRIAGGVAGLTAARVLPGYAKKYFPTLGTMGAGVDLLLGAASGMLAGMAASKFMGKQFGEDVTFGAILGVTDDALRMYVYPAAGLSAYLEPGLTAYLQPAGMSQYLSPGATIPSLGDLHYDFNEGNHIGAVDLPSRLNPNNRL